MSGTEEDRRRAARAEQVLPDTQDERGGVIAGALPRIL